MGILMLRWYHPCHLFTPALRLPNHIFSLPYFCGERENVVLNVLELNNVLEEIAVLRQILLVAAAMSAKEIIPVRQVVYQYAPVLRGI